jgi:hypothetical protein
MKMSLRKGGSLGSDEVRESRKKVVTQEAIRKQEVGSWGGGGDEL